jgi:hypothetical protein
MLPDFPKEKELLGKFWNEYLVRKHRELLGIFAGIPAFTVHEGDRWKLERTDGSESEQPYKELSSEFVIEMKDVPDLTPELIREKIDKVAEDAAMQMTKGIYKEIQQATEQAGNIVNAEGQPFSKEHFLELVEKVESDFTPDGQLIAPSLVMHPDFWKANEERFKEWEQDEEFTARHEEIINKKREEWRAREASRKLVD